MKVSEILGPTVQGEGPSIGRRAGFVRLGRCDLACSWCDTPYTWDWKGQNGVPYDPAKELHEMSTGAVVERVEEMGVGLVVVTGGEPFVQLPALIELARALATRGYELEVETNGRHAPPARLTDAVAAFNVSPKLPNSGQDLSVTIKDDALKALLATLKARFKFVCRDAADVELVADIARRLKVPGNRVWVMPEGRTPQAVHRHLREVAGAAIAKGFNISGRLHVDIWDDERGH